jgi:molybdate transport system substrate-binding protein
MQGRRALSLAPDPEHGGLREGAVLKLISGDLLALLLFVTSGHVARAAELQVLAGSGIAAPLNEIAATFEKATGHKLVIRYGTAPNLVKMATSGGPFDLAIVPELVMQDAATRAQLPPGALNTVARVGIGVAVRAGAPKPDISTPDALKQTLMKAQSVASIPASATGTLLSGIYDKLGIGDAMKAKTMAQDSPGGIADSVAKGESEIAVFLTNILVDPRLDVVGPFPAELQQYVIYNAGVALQSKEPAAAEAFLKFVMTPAAGAVIKSKGMTPG